MRGVLLVAFSSLKWNSFPSKKFQGRHMFHGIGAPHTSLANTAVSTPDIKREARWIPRGNTLGSCKANINFFFKSSSYNIQILFCALLNKNKNLLWKKLCWWMMNIHVNEIYLYIIISNWKKTSNLNRSVHTLRSCIVWTSCNKGDTLIARKASSSRRWRMRPNLNRYL